MVKIDSRSVSKWFWCVTYPLLWKKYNITSSGDRSYLYLRKYQEHYSNLCNSCTVYHVLRSYLASKKKVIQSIFQNKKPEVKSTAKDLEQRTCQWTLPIIPLLKNQRCITSLYEYSAVNYFMTEAVII